MKLMEQQKYVDNGKGKLMKQKIRMIMVKEN